MLFSSDEPQCDYIVIAFPWYECQLQVTVIVTDCVTKLAIISFCATAEVTKKGRRVPLGKTAYPTPDGGKLVPKAQRTGVGRTLPSGSCFGAQFMGSAPGAHKEAP